MVDIELVNLSSLKQTYYIYFTFIYIYVLKFNIELQLDPFQQYKRKGAVDYFVKFVQVLN